MKKTKYLSFVFLIALLFGLVMDFTAVAQTLENDVTAVAAAPQDGDQLAATISGLAVKYPIVLSILSFIGLCRSIAKPGCEMAFKIAEWTKWTGDNKFLEWVKTSSALKPVLFALDWLFSLKIVRK